MAQARFGLTGSAPIPQKSQPLPPAASEPVWLRRLVSATRSVGGLVALHDYTRGCSQITTSHRAGRRANDDSTRHVILPWLEKRQFFQIAGLVWRGSEILTRDERRRTAISNAVMIPEESSYTLHGIIAADKCRLKHVLLMRGRESDEYSDQDVAACRASLSMLNGDRYAGSLTRTEVVESVYQSVLDDVGQGVAIVQPPDTVLAWTPTFRDILTRLDPAPGKPGPASNVAEPAVFPPFLRQMLASERESSTMLFDGSDRRIACQVRPTPVPGQQKLHGSADRTFVVMLSDLDLPPSIDEEGIQALFQLSPTEARISGLVGRGVTIEDSATRLGITTSTARTHLKRIFDKTATHRQAELVKLLLGVARRKPFDGEIGNGSSRARDPDRKPGPSAKSRK